MTRRAAFWLFLMSSGRLLSQVLPDTTQDMFQDVHRIVAIGDVHGDYQRLLEVLRTAGQSHWESIDAF